VLISFIASLQLKPIEKLMMKLTTYAEKKSVCRILADSSTNADCFSVSQHCGKPHVGRSFIYT